MTDLADIDYDFFFLVDFVLFFHVLILMMKLLTPPFDSVESVLSSSLLFCYGCFLVVALRGSIDWLELISDTPRSLLRFVSFALVLVSQASELKNAAKDRSLFRLPWSWLGLLVASAAYPLDWGMPWQKFPVPNIGGYYVGLMLSQIYCTLLSSVASGRRSKRD